MKSAFSSIVSIFKPNILNSQPAHSERPSADAVPITQSGALQVVTELNRLVLALFGEFLREDGHSVDYEGMAKSEQFKRYKERVLDLEKHDVLSALQTPESKKCFFLNLYNMLLIHGFIQLGPPTSATGRGLFFSSTAYKLSEKGFVFTLNDIEHGVLRCNRKSPASLSSSPPFGKDDPRLAYVVPPQAFDARVHFALVCGARSCPPIRVYTLQNLDVGLTAAAKAFCGDNVNLKENCIELSSIFKWYATDFGDTQEHQLDYIAQFLGDEKRAQFQAARERKLPVKYADYDWSVNETGH